VRSLAQMTKDIIMSTQALMSSCFEVFKPCSFFAVLHCKTLLQSHFIRIPSTAAFEILPSDWVNDMKIEKMRGMKLPKKIEGEVDQVGQEEIDSSSQLTMPSDLSQLKQYFHQDYV